MEEFWKEVYLNYLKDQYTDLEEKETILCKLLTDISMQKSVVGREIQTIETGIREKK